MLCCLRSHARRAGTNVTMPVKKMEFFVSLFLLTSLLAVPNLYNSIFFDVPDAHAGLDNSTDSTMATAYASAMEGDLGDTKDINEQQNLKDIKTDESYEDGSFISNTGSRAVTSLAITAPLYFRPAIVVAGTALNVTANAYGATSSTVWKAAVHSKYARVFLSFVSATQVGGSSTWKLVFNVPQYIPRGMYNLTLSADDMQEVEWHCIAIVTSLPTNLKLAHITDLHVSDTEVENNVRIAKVVQELNLHAPDIVLISGDLTNGASFSQYRLLRKLLLSLDAPIITAPGNHDHNSISNYYKYVNPVLDYSFDIGQYHFVSIDSGPDVSGSLGATGLTSSQISFISSDLSSNAGKTFFILMHHPVYYDSQSTITQNKQAFVDICVNNSVKMIFGGHVHGQSVYDSGGHAKTGEFSSFTGPIFVTTVNIGNAFREATSNGYRIVQMNGGNVSYYSYDNDNDGTRDAYSCILYNKLNITYSNRTTASGTAFSAEIRNDLNEDLTLRVPFEATALSCGLDYSPSTGSKLYTTRSYEGAMEYVFVTASVSKRTSKIVEIVPGASSQADLAIVDVAGARTGATGAPATFSITVKASEAVTQTFRVSLMNAYAQSGIALDSKEVSGLGKNEQTTVTLSYVPQSSGYTTLIIVVDSTFVVAEPNEWNNFAYIEYESLTSGNVRPTAEAGSAINGKEERVIHFAGSGSDSDGSIVRYEWDFDGDGFSDYVGTTGSVDYIYEYTGNFTARLRVFDDKNARGEDTVQVNVVPLRSPEGYLIRTIAELLGDSQKYEGMAIKVASVSVADPKSYNTDAPNPTKYTDLDVSDTSTTARLTIFLYAQTTRLSSVNIGMKVDAQGQFSLYGSKWELKIRSDTDDYLREASGETGVPHVNAGVDKKAKVGEAVQFNGTAWDDDGYIAKYEWDYNGDGLYELISAASPQGEYEYESKGVYTATLRATDNEGNVGKASITVTVEVSKQPENYGWAVYVLVAIGLGVLALIVIGIIISRRTRQ